MEVNLLSAGMPILEWVGILGYGLVAWGMGQASDARLKTAVIAACLINALYFYALGMLISSTVVLLTAIRITVSLRYRHPMVGIPFLIGAASMPWWLPSGDVLAALAGVLGTIAVFWAQGLWLKRILLMGTVTWLVNNALSGAWIGVIGEAVILCFGLRYLWRHRHESSANR